MEALQIFIILGYIRIVAYSTLANFAYFFHPWIVGPGSEEGRSPEGARPRPPGHLALPTCIATLHPFGMLSTHPTRLGRTFSQAALSTPLLALSSSQFHNRLKTYLFHQSNPP